MPVLDQLVEDVECTTDGQRLHFQIEENEEGGFSVIALNLPGAGSSGPTEEVAIERAKLAVQAVIEDYRESGETIPWQDTIRHVAEKGTKTKWVVVHG